MHDETDFQTSAGGIAECLRLLADEAGMLNMTFTLNAIRHAMETCRAEGQAPTGKAMEQLLRSASSQVH